jgi:hypothetical protein
MPALNHGHAKVSGIPEARGACDLYGMRKGITLTVDAADRARLNAFVADRKRTRRSTFGGHGSSY